MRRLILSLTTMACPLLGLSQTFSGDSILANERSMDRPVTLHARQVRITGGYGLSIIAKRFDNSSEIVHLRDEGLASVRHRFNLDIKYGINDYIQFNAGIGHSSNVVREQSRYIIPLAPPFVLQDVMHEYKGLEDLFLGVDLRAPFKTRTFDLALTLGATLPVAPFDPAQPEHAFESGEENGMPVHRFNYHYYYAMGKGVPVGQIGGIVKYRGANWALSARLDYRHGLKDGASYEWRHQLDDEEFEYRQQPTSFRLPDSNTYHVEAEYQPMPWFNVFVIASGYTAFDGWTSRQEDVVVAIPYQTSGSLSPGFEIIITPRLWLRERIDFSVAGKNTEAPLNFQTTMMYNFFPINSTR